MTGMHVITFSANCHVGEVREPRGPRGNAGWWKLMRKPDFLTKILKFELINKMYYSPDP